MKKPTTRKLQIASLLIGVAGAVASCIWVGMAMNEYQQRTGYDAGNGGVVGCFAVILFPAIGWFAGTVVGMCVNAKPRHRAAEMDGPRAERPGKL